MYVFDLGCLASLLCGFDSGDVASLCMFSFRWWRIAIQVAWHHYADIVASLDRVT